MAINKKLFQMRKERPIQAKIKADSQDNVLYLYGDVGGWAFEDESSINLSSVKNQITEMSKDHVTIHIDSYGGNATEGIAIRNLLMDYFETIDVVIDGIAASAASVIALAGNLTMPEGSILMIHNPWSMALGDKQDLAKEIRALLSLEESYKDIYMNYFSGTRDELSELMDQESWLTVEEAQEYGFITEPTIAIEVDTDLILAAIKGSMETNDEVDKDETEVVDVEPTEKTPVASKTRLYAENLFKLGGRLNVENEG